MLQNDLIASATVTTQDDKDTNSSKDLSDFVLPSVRSQDFDARKAKEQLELAKQQKEEQDKEVNEPSTYFKSTQNKYLDDKLKQGTLTGMDIYVARKYLGLNLQEFGNQAKPDQNINLQAKIKNLGLTGLNDRLKEGANNQDLFDRAIQGSEGNLGVGSAIERGLNKITGGFKELDKGENEWLQTHREAGYALAKSRNSGRLTNQTIEQAQDDLALGLRGEQAVMEKYLAAKKTGLAAWGRDIQNALDHNLPIDPEVLQKYEKSVDSVAYIEDKLKKGKWGKSEYKEYASKYGKNYTQEAKDLNTAKQGFNNESPYSSYIHNFRKLEKNTKG